MLIFGDLLRYAISVSGIDKRFGKDYALRDISLELGKGIKRIESEKPASATFNLDYLGRIVKACPSSSFLP